MIKWFKRKPKLKAYFTPKENYVFVKLLDLKTGESQEFAVPYETEFTHSQGFSEWKEMLTHLGFLRLRAAQRKATKNVWGFNG
jgi:hypothetical protein